MHRCCLQCFFVQIINLIGPFFFSEELLTRNLNNGNEWYIFFIIAVAGTIVMLYFIAYVVMCSRCRRLRRRDVELDRRIQHSNENVINTESNFKPVEAAGNEHNSVYTELSKLKSTESIYQSLS